VELLHVGESTQASSRGKPGFGKAPGNIGDGRRFGEHAALGHQGGHAALGIDGQVFGAALLALGEIELDDFMGRIGLDQGDAGGQGAGAGSVVELEGGHERDG
jgi:hypothetical protein